MDAFVTGGSGFVGSHLLERLDGTAGRVRALARSPDSSRTVEELGAQPVAGDLGDVEAMAAGMDGCDVVFHLAALAAGWGPREAFVETNVRGTENVIEAARTAGVDRLVHTSTEAVLADGTALRNVDETVPYPEDHVGYYAETKAMAERRVLAADDDSLRTVAVRPRFVWGPRDETLLSEFVDAIESGGFAWFDGGRYPTSTTHVANAVEGHMLAATAGTSGEAYFVTDGDPVEFRRFITELVATQGVTPPDRSIPGWIGRPAATVLEGIWRLLDRDDPPPIDRQTVALMGQEMTVDDGKARRELGYEPVVSREEGLAELRQAEPGAFAVG